MLVDHDRRLPAQAVADVDHGLGQEDGFIDAQRQRGRGGEEGRQVHVGVAAAHHVADDGGKILFAQAAAIDALAHAGQGFQHRRVADLHAVAVAYCQRVPGFLGQRHFVEREQVAVDLVELGLHFVAVRGDQHLRARRQAFGTADVAVRAHQRYRLMLRVQAHARCAQRGRFEFRNAAHSSYLWSCSGTVTCQLSSRWMRSRSASEASGSPWTMKTRRGAS